MVQIFQSYNKRIKAWVKIKKYQSGATRILAIKKNMPKVAFAGIKKKR